MKYVGLYTQQRRNNARSLLLLLLFPTLIIVIVGVCCFVLAHMEAKEYSYASAYSYAYADPNQLGLYYTLHTLPWVLGGVGVWFVAAYFFNAWMIRRATNATSLERKDNPRIYNIVENLTMTCGMDMPKINIINSHELNAYASGINKNSYTVTVTTGLCDVLDDDELQGVIAHELTHIRNRDTRLLIVCIVFVGILSALMTLLFRMLWYTFLWGGSSRGRNSSDKKGNGGTLVVMIVAVVLVAIAYFFSLLTRFAISRKREYLADAGGAELCGNPRALASALRKISNAPYSARKGYDEVQQLFIIHPQALSGGGIGGWFSNLFSTHPSTKSRIEFLEQL